MMRLPRPSIAIIILSLLLPAAGMAQDAPTKQTIQPSPPAAEEAKPETKPAETPAAEAAKPPPLPPLERVDEAQEALKHGDYRTSFDRWLPRARKGEAVAQRETAKLYFQGQGTPKNDYAAYHWASLAARQNDPEAQYYMGLMYDEGIGTQRDYLTAARWYIQAAKQNEPRAQQRLGKLYMQGRGVPQDIRKARYWLQQASIQGNSQSAYQMGWLLAQQGRYARAMEYFLQAAQDNHAKAMGNLGWIFERGKGTKQDMVQAFVWYTLAERFSEDGEAVRIAARDRQRVAKLMTSMQQEEANNLLRNW